MEGIITVPFARALESRREHFNAQFAHARKSLPGFDPEVFSEHLRNVVAPVIDAVHEKFPESVESVTETLFSLSLELIGKEFLGSSARYPAITEGWKILLPSLSNLLSGNPRIFAGAVTNALYNLSVAQNARPFEWIESMREIGVKCENISVFLDAGTVLAWRCGMAHYRKPALETCKKLNPELVCFALGVPSSKDAVYAGKMIDNLLADPWVRPSLALQNRNNKRKLNIVSSVSGFRGFGGHFLRPPEVVCADNVFYVSDGEMCWSLYADVFGAALIRSGETMPETRQTRKTNFNLDKNGKVTKESYEAVFTELACAKSMASNETTLAVTVPLSHYVHLVALVEV